MKSKNLIKNGDASGGLTDWESVGADIATGERMEVTKVDEVTGDVTVELVNNPAFRLLDDPTTRLSQKIAKLSKRTDHLEVAFQYLTAVNGHLAHDVTLVVEYALGNVQRYIMPMKDDYRPLEGYKPFKAKKPSGNGTPIPEFEWTPVDTFMVTVEWIEHWSYVELLPNQEVVAVRIEVTGVNSTGKYALIDTFELTYNFDREDVGELTYVMIPAGATEVPVFSAVTDQTVTDVYLMPTEAINGAANPLELHLVNKANDVNAGDEVISTLTYTADMQTVPYQVVEWGNVEKVLTYGHGLSLKVASGTLPQSTLTICWYYEAPVGGFVDDNGEFIDPAPEGGGI